MTRWLCCHPSWKWPQIRRRVLKLKLYNAHRRPYARRTKIVLHEKGVECRATIWSPAIYFRS